MGPQPPGASTPRAAVLALAGIAVLFGALVATGLHGFSLAAWHEHIDASAPDEVWLGVPRPIRSDDWAVQIPLGLAQRAHRPPHPVVNSNIGFGQNMLVPVATPVGHFATAFRPALWGYFLGPDAGLAWMWWFELLGLIAVWSCVFTWVARGRAALGIAASVMLAYSPFLQFWSLNIAPPIVFIGLALLALRGVLGAARPAAIVGWGALLAWSAACFGLFVYPPPLVVLAHVGGLLAVTAVWESPAVLRSAPAPTAGGATSTAASHRVLRIGVLAAGGLAVAAIGVAFAFAARDAMELAFGTVYPGSRIATGGEVPWWRLFSSNLGLGLLAEDYGPLHNICEAAAFPLFFPVVGAAMLWRCVARDRRPDPLSLALLAYCIALFVYGQWGLPEWLARATGLGASPAPRAVLGTGVADLLLLVRFLSEPPSTEPSAEGERSAARVIALLWGVCLAAVAWRLSAELPGLPRGVLLAAAGAQAGIAYAILATRHPSAAVATLAGVAFLSTAWFNPLARGGSEYLRTNPLSARILELDAAHGGESVWLTYGSPKLPNLVWALGVRSLGGTLTAPQSELWEALDPEGEYDRITNRYAHVEFVGSRSDRPGLRLLSRDSVRVAVDPLAPVIRRDLGATHLLLRARGPDRAAFERRSGLTPLFAVGYNAIYALPPWEPES